MALSIVVLVMHAAEREERRESVHHRLRSQSYEC